MKRGFRILACVLVLMMLPMTLLLFAFVLPSQYEHTFLGALRDKWERLKVTPSPRIIIAGGSGAAFGVDSELLESFFSQYSVVNMGMYAGLGSTVTLDLIQPFLQSGDIVIFMPEQSEQTLSMYFNAESMWQAADGCFEMLTTLNKEDLFTMAGHFPEFAADKFNLWRDGVPLMPEGVYSRAAFNEWGDVANVPREYNIMPEGVDKSMPISFEGEWLSEDFAAYVREYAEQCARQDVCFLYRFCPMNADALTDGALNGLDEYCTMLTTVLKCPLLGDGHSSVMESGWFYDTNFHLNDAGVTVNTVRMAQELAKYLDVTIPVPNELPAMPALQAASVQAGDNADENFFEYEAIDGGWRIVGLNQAGRRQERLTVPVSREGLPIVAFDASVFAGNSILKEVTIQGNIAHMDDGSFEGCRNLERIVLKQNQPQHCTVGQGLLRGTDANVYVPAESISAYITNYFWAVHAPRLYAVQCAGEPIASESEKEEAYIEKVEPLLQNREIITYHGNGALYRNGSETMTAERSRVHLRSNTLQGTRYLSKEGYVLNGWNTQADGSGAHISLGSRVEYQEGLTLYAQWAKANPAEDFTWTIQRNEVHITKYIGNSLVCVVPEKIEGKKVTRICRDAFRDAMLDEVILPSTLFAIEREAFAGCTLRELSIYDTLYYVYDESFSGCEKLTTLHIHAATSPAYSGTYFDTFSDKYDRLLSIWDEQKMVLFSGSSGRFGYDSAQIEAAFEGYQVVNMGVYAYTNALPQLDLILKQMNKDDILLSAPEFDTLNNQFCTTNALDAHFFALIESNYDALAELDLRKYTHVFQALGKYLTVRSPITSGSYELSPNGLDDEGNAYPFDTYNEYGDLILPRAGSEQDVLLQKGLADYTTGAFAVETIECLNDVYRRFLEKDVKVYFSYTPRNWSSLTADSTPQARAELHEHLKAHLCVPVISDIEDYLYSGRYFYLIDSHLSSEGVQLRTRQIIEDLSAQMAREQE